MASYFQRMISAGVATELASMGGDLLSTYGKSTDPDDKAMARLGGYMLERFKPQALPEAELESGAETE